MSKKIGGNHARAMFYQGLAELGNALTTDSNVSQRHLEHGIYGHGEAPATGGVGLDPSVRPQPSLDQYVRNARAQAERVPPEAGRESPERE